MLSRLCGPSQAFVLLCIRHCVGGFIGKGTHWIIFSQARCGQGFASQAEQFHGNGEAHQLGELSMHFLWWVVISVPALVGWLVAQREPDLRNDNGLMNENDASFYTDGISSIQTGIWWKKCMTRMTKAFKLLLHAFPCANVAPESSVSCAWCFPLQELGTPSRLVESSNDNILPAPSVISRRLRSLDTFRGYPRLPHQWWLPLLFNITWCLWSGDHCVIIKEFAGCVLPSSSF